MEDLTERQRSILALIVQEYVRLARPIGSEYLVEHYHLMMSPATVRNEMVTLTDMGYLRQPHTSAGREPTEEGYRYFVGRLLHETSLPDATQRTINHQFYQMRFEVDQWMKLAASVLAQQSKAASLVTAPRPAKVTLKHLELVATRGSQVLMVLVLRGGELHQRLITLREPVPQEILSELAEHFNAAFQGMDWKTIHERQSELSDFEAEVAGELADLMRQIDQVAAGEIYVDGLTNVLAEPEFIGSEQALEVIRLIEEKSLIQELLAREDLLGPNIGNVQVLIGGEGKWEALRDWSLILARYGTPGQALGALGVIGPVRMYYGRGISVVRFLSGLLSDLISETIAE